MRKKVLLAISFLITLTALPAISFSSEIGKLLDNPLGLPSTVQRRTELGYKLFEETDNLGTTPFERKLCASLKESFRDGMCVSFCSIVITFFQPSKDPFLRSVAEMVNPTELVRKDSSRILRTNLYSEEIPLVFVQLLDPKKPSLTAEVDVLLSVGPSNDFALEKRTYIR